MYCLIHPWSNAIYFSTSGVTSGAVAWNDSARIRRGVAVSSPLALLRASPQFAKTDRMYLNFRPCKRCGEYFLSDAEHCPNCNKLSPVGRRHLLLKLLAVLIFLMGIALILYSVIHSHHRQE